jgi:uncharacterized membrane protein
VIPYQKILDQIRGDFLRNRRPDLAFIILLIVMILLAVGLTWVNQTQIVPKGGDEVFAPIWEAARYANSHASGNPYLPDAVRRARILLESRPTPARFLYPYYSLILFGPISLISPYSLARAVWMTLMVVCSIGLAFTGLVATRWRPRFGMMVLYLVFSLGSYQAVRAMFLGNPAVVVSLLVAVSLLLVTREQDGLAGIFLGLGIIKPQMVALLLPYVFIWAVSNRRMGLVWSLLATTGLLVGGSFYFFPQWFLYQYGQLLRFFVESFPSSPGAVLWTWLPNSDSNVMAIFAIGLSLWLLVEWWQSFGKNVRWFLWTAAFTIVISSLIGLPVSLSDHILLIIPFVLVFSTWVQRWKVNGERLAAVVMVLIFAAGWGLAWSVQDGSLTSVPAPGMFFFTPVVALILLYWVRYWALNAVKLKVSHIEALRRL